MNEETYHHTITANKKSGGLQLDLSGFKVEITHHEAACINCMLVPTAEHQLYLEGWDARHNTIENLFDKGLKRIESFATADGNTLTGSRITFGSADENRMIELNSEETVAFALDIKAAVDVAAGAKL